MKNTSQIIGVQALLTFAVLSMPPQQMFAHLLMPGINQLIDAPLEAYPWKSVIITEIMADPSPPQGLPEVEYVELFNRSSAAIPLAGWRLSDTRSSAELTNITLEPGEYVAIASKSLDLNDASQMIAHLPSLNNSSDSLSLTDPSGRVIDAVNYTDDWYGDGQRSGGGWSLELIDPENTCESSGNWSVTEDINGGTPGKPNSILASNPDVAGPMLVSVQAVDNLTLRIRFNEKLAQGTLTPGWWTITPSLQVSTPSFADSSRSVIDFHLDEPLASGMLYNFSVESVFDCSGNQQQALQHAAFALPERASRGDIVINELLFNPSSDGVDFLELFNASKKYVSLNGWAIGSMDDDGNLTKTFIEQEIILRPDGYIALSADPQKLTAHYNISDSTQSKLRLPSYPDDHGIAIVMNDVDSVMDAFAYSSDMHSVFLRNAEGVSLERLSANVPAADRSNWMSAASSAGFATPGKRNSVSRQVVPQDDHPIHVLPRAFTPLTGQPNFCEISYRFDQPGLVATVSVCDNRGMTVRRLANNTLLGTEGVVRWEGDLDNGARTQTGYYVVCFQVFSADGWARIYRETVAVSPRY